MRVEKTEKGLIKMWTDGVHVEEQAMQQLRNIADMPFIYKHVAVMPDVHLGKGATVGSVIPTTKAIIPAAVGVDIGCGMMAVKTSLKAADLPDSLANLRGYLEDVIPLSSPAGRTPKQYRANSYQAIEDGPLKNIRLRVTSDVELYSRVLGFTAYTSIDTFRHQIGSLGGGNHFIELNIDEVTGDVWITLHSGSRGFGNRVGNYFINKAKEEMEKYFIDLPDKDLAFLPKSSKLFEDYVDCVDLAQNYASLNRSMMMEQIKEVLREHFSNITFDMNIISCHHNYISRENHFGENVYVTRKGAVMARQGVLGIIPGSMGTRTYIVQGRGHPDSFCSCSHGAGRVMSRTEASKRISLEEHAKATEGVECRKDAAVIDESPAAYKNLDAVMKAQESLVDIIHTLKPVLCIKG